MKTREQAEQRAFKLWPYFTNTSTPDDRMENKYNAIRREAFLQCWDETQDNQLREAAERVIDRRKNLHIASGAEPFCHHNLKMAVKELDSAYQQLEKALK